MTNKSALLLESSSPVTSEVLRDLSEVYPGLMLFVMLVMFDLYTQLYPLWTILLTAIAGTKTLL